MIDINKVPAEALAVVRESLIADQVEVSVIDCWIENMTAIEFFSRYCRALGIADLAGKLADVYIAAHVAETADDYVGVPTHSLITRLNANVLARSPAANVRSILCEIFSRYRRIL